MVLKLNFNDYQEIIERNHSCVIKFGSEGCMPCEKFNTILDEISPKFKGRVRFFNVDIDEEPKLASLFNVKSVPTVFFIKDGKMFSSALGLMNKNILYDFLQDTYFN
jgi:thioredoxin 1